MERAACPACVVIAWAADFRAESEDYSDRARIHLEAMHPADCRHFSQWLLGWETVPARPPPPASKWRERREVDRCGGRDFSGPGRDIDHLPGLRPPAFLGIRREIDENLPAETDYLDAFVDIRDQEISARDRSRDGASLNFPSSGTRRRGKEHRSAVQNDFASAGRETKERVGSYPGDCQIRELQFRPGIAPVLSALSPLTTSPGVARVCRGKSETTLMTLVTSACSKVSADKPAGRGTTSNKTKIQCLID